MKKTIHFTVLIFSITVFNTSVNAQSSQQRIDQVRQREAARRMDAQRRMQQVMIDDRIREEKSAVGEEKYSSILQMELSNSLKELENARDSLLVAFSNKTDKRQKELEKSANKVAKVSHKLRKKLNEGNSTPDVQPLQPSGDLDAQIRELVIGINRLVKEVKDSEERIVWTVDQRMISEALDKLETIERQGITIKSLTKK